MDVGRLAVFWREKRSESTNIYDDRMILQKIVLIMYSFNT